MKNVKPSHSHESIALEKSQTDRYPGYSCVGVEVNLFLFAGCSMNGLRPHAEKVAREKNSCGPPARRRQLSGLDRSLRVEGRVGVHRDGRAGRC